MKKLLLIPTILLLVSCQPSELERCVVANTQPTPINDYLTKTNKWDETVKSLLARCDDKVDCYDFLDFYTPAVNEYLNSLNPLEKIVRQCVEDKGLQVQEQQQSLPNSEKKGFYEQHKESCMISTENEVKELQLKIEAQNKENAKSVCHSQGIY